MTKRLLLATIATIALSLCGALRAAVPPTVSTGEKTVWYIVQFLNGSNVLEAQADGAEVKTAVLDGGDAQLWKIEGDDAQGYELTSKTGLKLHTTSTALNGMFKASAAPTSNTRFVWTTSTNASYNGEFMISPKANTSVYMNQWTGAGTGKSLGLWNERASGDQPLKFATPDELLRTDQKLDLIPYPRSVVYAEGSLPLASLSGIGYVDATTQHYATELAERIKLVTGHELAISAQPSGTAVKMTVDEKLAHEEYRLAVTAEGVSIAASDSAGFFYALQTVKQLLPHAIYGSAKVSAEGWSLPYVTIEDKPQFAHRGFMLDIARHFYSKTEVKRILDIMASYKLNRFHWHLTDDQGWRVEIPEYPKLTEVGSIRSGSLANAGGTTKFYDDTEYGRGMFYTLNDLREIVKYAKDRNIEIIPEVDLPGHMVAAVASYPELSCDPEKTYSVRLDGGISKDVLNVGDDKVIDFLKTVLSHIADVFPYPYIHIGGDECPTDQWRTNEMCLERVRAEGLTGVEQLQSWLVETLGTWLQTEKGKHIIVWDELLSHWSQNNSVKPVIMAWTGIGKSAEAAAKGFKSIITPYQNVYLDFYQVDASRRDIDEPYQGGWGDGYVNSLQSVYNLNPVASLAGKEDFCLGVQANMWTETCSDTIQLEYQLFPRLLALSETAWLPASEKSYSAFKRRMQSHAEVMDAAGFNYCRHEFNAPELTAAEAALAEAASIIEASRPGEPGYPSAEELSKLTAATDGLKADKESAEKLESLNTALTAYKKAAITMPEAGKLYRITSAATYYKARYEGSTAYAAYNDVKFHYTPQTEPEEVWEFIPGDGTFHIKNALNGKELLLANQSGTNTTFAETGSPFTIKRATGANGGYTYIPGVVTIGKGTSLLTANSDGYVKTGTDAKLCNPGTWRIEEISDFTAWLEGLVKKCQLILINSDKVPTQEQADFISKKIIAPAQADIAAGGVTKQKYEEYAALYAQYKAEVPAVSIDPNHYYRIREAYPQFSSAYAAANASTKQVDSKSLVADDNAFLWRFVENADGTVSIYNALTGTAAYPASQAGQAKICVGQDYRWTLDEAVLDGNKGIRIISENGQFGWYTNPNVWAQVILQPKTYGACIWTLEKLNIETGINEIPSISDNAPTIFYDLSGRRVEKPTNGIYITNKGQKLMIK